MSQWLSDVDVGVDVAVDVAVDVGVDVLFVFVLSVFCF